MNLLFSHADHVFPVSSKFFVGPERTGIWDVRGHRHYAALLQAAKKKSQLSSEAVEYCALCATKIKHLKCSELKTESEFLSINVCAYMLYTSCAL
jgi:hypothetical protein